MEMNLYLRALRRGWWMIVITMIIAVNTSLLISYFTVPIYRATSRFILSPNAVVYESSWDIVSSLDVLEGRSIINTYKEVLESPSVYGKNPEIQRFDPDVLAKKYKISVFVVPDTNILEMTIDGPDPNQVYALANAIGAHALDYMNQLYPVYNFSILEQAILPTKPIKPETLQNAGLALLLGIFIGAVLAFSRDQLQNTMDQLRVRSIIDVASSAYTRSFFVRKLREEITQNPDRNLALGIINLRGLGDLTNVLPQPVTARLIYSLTQKLREELRGRDIVGRWDNHQLAVLLPSASTTAAHSTFKRIQDCLSEPIQIDQSGDLIVQPDPCIGVVTRDQFEMGDELIERGEEAVEKASSFEKASVVFLSNPFVAESPAPEFSE
jgi:capsular polysaccharide biosynthesis protein